MRRPNPSFLKKLCLAVCMGMLFHGACPAQCVNNLGLQTFDTTLNNNGFTIFNIKFPQFNPDSGQLVSVKISANVTSTYGFNLRNVNTNDASYDLSIGQEDQIIAGGASPYLNITPLHVGTYSLSPGQSMAVSPFPFLTNHVSADSITSGIAPFLGVGKINVNYMSFCYTNLWANDNASYYYSNAINTTTQLSMQYLFCKTGIVLAADLTRWTAQLTAQNMVKLDWATANETAGRRYEIQRSSDGHVFTPIATLNSNAGAQASDYAYTDQLPHDANGKFYYRLQINDNGKFTWSPVKEISIDAAEKSLRIYPNSATDHIDIATGTPTSDWHVDLYSSSGGRVQQATFLQSNLLHVVFSSHLPPGTYFARITDLRGQQVYSRPFVVR